MIKSLPYDRIREIFSALAGVDDGEGEVFCTSAAESILCRIRKSADPDVWTRPLCYAAGALAYYRYCLKKETSPSTSFKVGDLSFSENAKENTASAKALFAEALESVRDVLSDSFAFISI